MRVLHIALSVQHSSAAYRIHQALLEINVESEILAFRKSIKHKSVILPNKSVIRFAVNLSLLVEHLLNRIIRRNDNLFFSFNFLPIPFLWNYLNYIDTYNPDIVHLHWYGHGVVSLRFLSRIKKPICITLHDNWPITGGCHVPLNCNKFPISCANCPKVRKPFQSLIKKLETVKLAIIKEKNIWLIAPSAWVLSNIHAKKINKALVIPNIINLNTYKVVPRSVARETLNLKIVGKKVIGFGGVSIHSDKNKGYKNIVEAIANLNEEIRKSVILIVFGGGEISDFVKLGMQVIHLGFMHKESEMNMVYNSCDVVLLPSFLETYSQVTLEALACGTPVVAFDATGPKDIIEHGINGYLAKSYDTRDFAHGILKMLSSNDETRSACRKRIEFIQGQNYVVKKHLELYSRIII